MNNRHLIIGSSSATRGAFYNDSHLQLRANDLPSFRKARMLLTLKKTSMFEWIWYPVFFLAGLLCLIFIRPLNFELCFSVLSFFLYMIANNLVARGSRWGIVISVIASILYTIVSFFAKVYGEVITNVLLYIPLDVIALFSFKKVTNEKTNDLDVKSLSTKAWLITIALTIVSSGVVFVILKLIPGQIYPLLNAISIVMFLVAMFTRNLRYKEFWWFNLLGNLVSIILWVFVSMMSSDMLYSLPFAISSLASLLNNIYGIIVWQRIYRVATTNGGIYVKAHKVKIKKVIKLRRQFQGTLKWEGKN